VSGGKEPEEDRGFRVVDRRASAGGTDTEPPRPSEPPREPRSQQGPAANEPWGGESVDFSMLVQSFAITAMHHLGLVADPAAEQRAEPNLALARQNIDILELLERKTHGNLEESEAHLLASLLYEVRMHFVKVSERQGG
jgi:hypothetical protein